MRVRNERDIPASDPVTPAQVAHGLNVRLLPANELPGLQTEVLARLTNHYRSAWSAITISEADRHLVVFNPAHSRARQSSDVMHELAHIILKHTPTFSFINPEKKLLIRSHDKSQEEEASWLAAAVLLPRQVLLYVRSRRLSDEEICRRYSVSRQLLAFRLNATGVERQLSRRGVSRR